MAVFQRLPGKARRFVDLESGKEYSRREHDALVGRQTRKNASAIRHKQRLYYSLLDSYIDKKNEKLKKGEKPLTRGKARQSDEMKKIVKDLKSKDPFRKLSALKRTTRRDGVPDTIPIGETPAVYSSAA